MSYPDRIITNVTNGMFKLLIDHVIKEEMRDSFLDPSKRLVLIDRNPAYVDRMAFHLARSIGIRKLFRMPVEFTTLELPHHQGREATVFRYKNNDSNHPVREIIARAKGDTSIAEKITRRNLEDKCGMASHIDPKRLFVSDLDAITFVTDTEEDARTLSYFNGINGFLQVFDHEDLYKDPRNYSDYKAIHDDAVWNDSNDRILDGRRIEVHYVAQVDRERNLNGNSDDDPTSHANYARSKLLKPHGLTGYQVVIVSHDTLIEAIQGGAVNGKSFKRERVRFSEQTGLNMTGPIEYDVLQDRFGQGRGLKEHGNKQRTIKRTSAIYA